MEVHAAAITFDELTWEETWTRAGADRTPIIPSHEVSGVVAAVAPGVTGLRRRRRGLRPDPVRPRRRGRGVRGRARRGPGRPPEVGVPRRVGGAAAGRPDRVAGARRSRESATGENGFWCSAARAGLERSRSRWHSRLGADVTATDPRRHRRLGAGLRCRPRHRHADTEAMPRAAYDVVIDTIGGDTLARSFAVLRPGGRLVTLSAPPPDGMADEYGVTATFFIVTPNHEQLRRWPAWSTTASCRSRSPTRSRWPTDARRSRAATQASQTRQDRARHPRLAKGDNDVRPRGSHPSPVRRRDCTCETSRCRRSW